MATPKKYYVVWVGKHPGIFDNWPDAQAQVAGFPAAKYKSYKTWEEANAAYRRPWQEIWEQGKKAKGEPRQLDDKFLEEIEANSIAVDAACSGNPGKMEYRGVYTLAPEMEVFRSKVFPVGTNNIGEFLAIVHALAMFSKDKPDLTIYSDSKLAIGWVIKKECRTKLPHNQKTDYLFQLIQRAERWLQTHEYENNVLKWETKRWGEIPADFGRK